MNKDNLIRFAKTISGKYSNKSQSQQYPKDFAHINIYFIPMEWSILEGPSLYSEQSYNHDPWSPYRQAVIKICIKEDNLILENYQLKNLDRIAGAGEKRELLFEIDKEKLNFRKGCSMHFKELKLGNYLGRIEPGKNCINEREGKISYVESEVEVIDDKWISKDEGFDINTHKKSWGSNNGPFIFEKVTCMQSEINKIWLCGK